MAQPFIAEASSDESNRARGGAAGDQKQRAGSGKEEVGVKRWYNRTGGWGVCLECLDEKLGEAAAENAKRIANDDSFGYDQDDRSSAYKAIMAAGGNIEAAADSELDCSVLVFIAYKLAGLNIEVGYTGNLESRFLATGKFVAHREAKYLTTGEYAKKGWIYLMAGKHTMIVVSDGGNAAVVEAPAVADAPQAPVAASNAADVPYVEVLGGSVYVRAGANTSGAIIGTVHREEVLPFLGIDSGTGWFKVETPRGVGFITNRPDLTKLVLK